MTVSSLKSKAIHGLFWSLCERMVHQGVQLVVWIVLARLLLPKEFGLVAMLAIFMEVTQAFLDSGFGHALIQKKDAAHVDSCSIFYFNIAVGLIVAGFLCLAAPWIASFYNQPLLKPLTRVMSLCIVINSFGLIQTTLLIRSIDFRTQMEVSITATILSGIIGVALALKEFGVWSLAIQQVSNSLFRTIFLWILNTWRPSLVFSLTALRNMFAFGSHLLASGLLNTVFENIYLVVIGKLFPPAALGFYSYGTRIRQLPMGSLSSIANRVTFPIFSTIQDDLGRLKRGMRQALRSLVFLHFPMMVGLAAVARPLVHVLLTEKWTPCIPYLQLLCFAGLLYPLQVLNHNLMKAKGRSDLYFRLSIILRILSVISIIVTYRWGILALIYGQAVVNCLGFYFNSYYAGTLIGYPPREQICDMLPYFGIAILMGLGVHSVQWLWFFNNYTLLMLQALSGIIIYSALSGCLRLDAFIETCQLIALQKRNLPPAAKK